MLATAQTTRNTGTNQAKDNIFVLAASTKSAVTMNDGVKRWFDDGDIVSFSLVRRLGDNGLFKVNHQEGWEIWWSQLSRYMYNGDIASLASSEITFKNGTTIKIASIASDMNKFMVLVGGKSFRVKILDNMCLVPADRNIAKSFSETLNLYRAVHAASNLDKFRNMLKGQKQYSFTEV